MPLTYTEPVLDWYAANARDLPWRRPGTSPWSVLVSEIMLQQTPVSRVLAPHAAWLDRWPTPAALAADAPGEAVRQWGRLGYPRRALRLHETARIVTERHAGEVPADHDALRALPGLGAYTAAAVAVFAFGGRHPVLDTNVRRVLARLAGGQQFPGAQPSRAEYRLAEELLPRDPETAATWSVAVMELGALTCTAARPRCEACPVAAQCAWLSAGRPPATRRRPGQRYEGTDRQCRGRLLALLRESPGPLSRQHLDIAWPDAVQRARALDGLVADGLVDPLPADHYGLPLLPGGTHTSPPRPPRLCGAGRRSSGCAAQGPSRLRLPGPCGLARSLQASLASSLRVAAAVCACCPPGLPWHRAAPHRHPSRFASGGLRACPVTRFVRF